jgi:hypothetical protein
MPRQLAIALSLAASILPWPGPATATPVFKPGYNQLVVDEFMNHYRTASDCTTSGTCLAHDASIDPVGFSRADPSIASNILAGDVIAGVLNVKRIDNPGGTPIWTSAPGDQFTGYFAVKIQSITAPGGDPSGLTHLAFVPSAVDPFGVLGSGEMFRLYTDGMTGFSAGITPFSSIASAIDGVMWGALGQPAANPGYAYAHVANGGALTAFYALDLIMRGPAYNAGTLAPVNDLGESEVGGSAVGSPPGSALCAASDIGTVACNDIIGISNIIDNPAFPGSSSWMLKNDAVFAIAAVPVPGTLPLVLLALPGLWACSRRQRSRRQTG